MIKKELAEIVEKSAKLFKKCIKIKPHEIDNYYDLSEVLQLDKTNENCYREICDVFLDNSCLYEANYDFLIEGIQICDKGKLWKDGLLQAQNVIIFIILGGKMPKTGIFKVGFTFLEFFANHFSK